MFSTVLNVVADALIFASAILLYHAAKLNRETNQNLKDLQRHLRMDGPPTKRPSIFSHGKVLPSSDEPDSGV